MSDDTSDESIEPPKVPESRPYHYETKEGYGYNPADRNYKPDGKKSNMYSDGVGMQYAPKGSPEPGADEQTSRQHTKRSARRYNIFGATEHGFNKPGMEDLKQQYMMAKTAKQPNTYREEYRGRPRAMSSVPDLCIDKGSVTLTDIVTASYRIRDGTIKTPCEKAVSFPGIQDYDVYFKREYLQVFGSYKARGALNALLTLSEEQLRRGVMTTSTGSHALAVAGHGKELGVPVTILVPENVPPRKVKICDRYGAKTRFAGQNDREVQETARKIETEAEGLTFIDENESSYVISGHGTVGLEIIDQVDDIDAIIIPVGGGGLLAGICVVFKALNPDIKIIVVESNDCPSFQAALDAGEPVTLKTELAVTLADGLSDSKVGDLPFKLVKDCVDKVVAVKEQHIAQAVLRLLEKERVIVEGSGAAGLAAIIGGYLPELKGKRVVIPLCGGNIDPTVLGRAIERGLTADERMVRFHIRINDRPGALARLTSLLSSTGVSIKDLYQERTWLNSSMFTVQVKCVAELRNAEHVKQLKKVLHKNYKDDLIWNIKSDE
ncbi:uncharacterized protein LOC116301684 [Actinia tenebrosa]|uniref:L-serine deaminase n=1 Tax=Actinia tenebrosa TaxID=6105 RepID=A0A6P8IIX2_ACTTE|nr:uncharacterized protein LOC116301684 [Actinia tenebrosa]